LTTVPLPPPTCPMRTVSPSADRLQKAQESGRFSRTAVHLGLRPEARNPSLTPSFLCSCSPGPFGTHSDFPHHISSIADLRGSPSFELALGWAKRNGRTDSRSLACYGEPLPRLLHYFQHVVVIQHLCAPAPTPSRAGPARSAGRRMARGNPLIRRRARQACLGLCQQCCGSVAGGTKAYCEPPPRPSFANMTHAGSHRRSRP
jgi:hypothetical protein